MKIRDFFENDSIILELNSKTKVEVLEELTKPLTAKNPALNSNEVVSALLAREKLGSTGIGDGIAIPHGKVKGLDRIVASFGRSTEGVDFDAMDKAPVHLFFLLVAPENTAGAHLKALARISRILKNTGIRKRLMDARTREEIYKLIIQEDEKYPA